MGATEEPKREQVLQVLDQQHHASRTRVRYRVLRHPLRFGYPTPSRLRAWKQRGVSVQAEACTPWGQRLVVTLPDDVSVCLRWNGYFEYELSAFYLRFLRPGMTFFDVGAHVGYFSMLASYAVGPTGRIVAFEPTPSTYKVLQMNARARCNVTPTNTAVWSEPSMINLRDFGPGFSAYNSAFDPRLPDSIKARLEERTHQVPAVTLDDYASEHGLVPDVVKIDVESAELHVLRGMQQMLSGPRPIVSLEVGDLGVSGAPRSRHLLEAVLSFDYQAFELRDGGVVPHQPRDDYSYDNIVFAPAERDGELCRGGNASP
ncbi:FkbM family methyltransferase [Streptomyces sp. NPDC052107]|uniref:FkbM family methyltransferase n=1 Tax=Streptomyces sp. NPDC052107 TaxID=3155632 RepID=UPI003421FECD